MEKKVRYKVPRNVYNIGNNLNALYEYSEQNGGFFPGTLDDLALLLGTTRKTLYNWERNGYIKIDEIRMKVNGVKGFSINKLIIDLMGFWDGFQGGVITL